MCETTPTRDAGGRKTKSKAHRPGEPSGVCDGGASGTAGAKRRNKAENFNETSSPSPPTPSPLLVLRRPADMCLRVGPLNAPLFISRPLFLHLANQPLTVAISSICDDSHRPRPLIRRAMAGPLLLLMRSCPIVDWLRTKTSSLPSSSPKISSSAITSTSGGGSYVAKLDAGVGRAARSWRAVSPLLCAVAEGSAVGSSEAKPDGSASPRPVGEERGSAER